MAIIKRPETKILYSQFKYKGKRYLRSTETTNLQKAEAWERRFRTALEDADKQATASRTVTPPLKELQDLDLKRAEAEGKDESYRKRGIENNWKWLRAYFENTRDITSKSLSEYVKHRRDLGRRGQTISKELVTLKRGLRLGKEDGYPIEIPVTWPKVAESEPHAGKAGRLLDAKDLRFWLSYLEGEARAMALLALLTGLRSGELYRVQPDWIKRLDEGSPIPAVLRLPKWATKGRRKREVGLVQAALEAVELSPFKSEHKKAYATATRHAIGSEAHGIHLRDLRHTCATVMADRTGDELGVAMVLGHASGLMTLHYQTANVERLAKLANAVWAWLGTSLEDITVKPVK